MLPNPKVPQQAISVKAELNQMLLLLERIKTGGWKIPPHYDPTTRQFQEMNKTLEAITQGR